jgi:YggT family protein
MSDLGVLITQTVFGVVIFLFLIRLLLQATRSDFYNPISQAVVRFTSFLDPLRAVLGARAGIDFATLLVLVALQMAQLATLAWLQTGMVPALPLLLGFGGIELLHLLLQVAFWAVIASIILSWIAPSGPNPAAQLLWSLTEPMMRPARKLLPPIGGLDFSPIIVLLVIRVLDGWGLAQLHGLLLRVLI